MTSMGFLIPYVFLSCISLCALKFVVAVVRLESLMRRMPPGPPARLVVGSALQLGKFPFLRFTEWGRKYGPIFSIHLAGQPVIVLSDFTVAADLIDRRSSKYSDRPRLIMVKLLTKDLALPFSQYGDLWRDMRKATHENFNIHVVKNYQRTQQQAAHHLLVTLLVNSREHGWEHDVESSLASSLISVIYGMTLQEARERKDIVNYVEDLSQRLGTAALPGGSLIDMFPALERIPHFINPWTIRGEKSFQSDTRVLAGLLNEVRARMAIDGTPNSFCGDLLEQERLTETHLAWLCGTLYTAGVETTSSTLQVFFLAMVLYPEVMHKAQQEIDTIVGRDRLPNFDDADDLPYIDALIREVMRWRPTVPMGIPKRCAQDDFYEGYLIPKGAIIIQNVWAMHHNEKYFEDPEVFKPERYLDSTGKVKNPIPDTHGYSHGTFGSGRRICVGRDLAYQSLFINIATILWSVNIAHCVDENGVALVPSADALVDKGVVVRPAAFPCVITARASDVEAKIAMALDEA